MRNQPAMLHALELGPAKLPFTYTPFAALLFAAASVLPTWQVGLAGSRSGCCRGVLSLDSPGGPPAWPGWRRHLRSPRWASGSNRLR